MVKKENAHKCGIWYDLKQRVTNTRIYLSDKIKIARFFIFEKGHTAAVERVLKPFSIVPTSVCLPDIYPVYGVHLFAISERFL